MSFILDALKKSESDHQRQGGPALFEVKLAPPRSALPPWAIAIAVLFAANLGVVLWLLLRHGSAPPEAPPPAAAARAQPPPAAAAMVSTPAPMPAPTAAPVTAPAVAPAPAAPAAALTAGERGAPAPAAEPAANPDDYAPAAEPPAPTMSHVQRGTGAGVPLYEQLAANPGKQLPQLRLDLLAYSEKADDRWVLVNMHKLHEGDSLAEGARVERITPDGAVLSWHGEQFLLTRE